MIFEKDRREQETMMHVAERYMEELANRCMIEIKVHEQGKHAITKLESCRIHDLMRDLCLAKAKEENLYKLVDRSTSQDSPYAIEAQNIHELKIVDCLCKKLPDYQSHMFPDPAILAQLKLYCTRIEEDPIGTLERLLNLRMLELGMDSFRGQEMICHSMGFPQLKHLGLHGLGNVKQWKVEEGAMPKLSSLRIRYCKKIGNDSTSVEIFNQVVTLVQMPKEFNNSVRVENVQQGEDYDKINHVPSVNIRRNIHELKIVDCLCKKLPDYQSHMFPDPAILAQLKLYCTRIEEDPIGTLERLLNLRMLELGMDSFRGQEMICHSMGFPQLKHLGLHGLGNVKQWKVEEGAMPKLSSLRIRYCKKIGNDSTSVEIFNLVVTLVQMPKEFNNRVRVEDVQQGEDYDKISHVPSVNIRRTSSIVTSVL
ncbi:probable disease resistance protein RF45 [Coffea eugenioides]|uniref:probable disease resistance protein RF45 n=1 Tax=Coffea eugenioides TaxID=49369 RepID=UPI000F61505D|nr:probable disease resistance protein RF45 [Coffea eugenioides]